MSEPAKPLQRWDLDVLDRHHRVEVDASGWNRVISWFVDDTLVARTKTMDDNPSISPGDGLDDHERDDDLGVIVAKFSSLGRVRRITWFGNERLDGEDGPPDDGPRDDGPRDDGPAEDGDKSPALVHALLGIGGIDLDPEPGSPAALREEKIRAHPRRYAAIHTAGGVAKVVVPLLLGLIAVRIVIDIPWPDWNLPSIPWPSIPWPTIPWPDWSLPSIPWPDWRIPDWVRWLLDKAKYVIPILLAWGFAQKELRRRRKQDQLKAKLRGGSTSSASSTGGGPSGHRDEEQDDGEQDDGDGHDDSDGDHPTRHYP